MQSVLKPVDIETQAAKPKVEDEVTQAGGSIPEPEAISRITSKTNKEVTTNLTDSAANKTSKEIVVIQSNQPSKFTKQQTIQKQEIEQMRASLKIASTTVNEMLASVYTWRYAAMTQLDSCNPNKTPPLDLSPPSDDIQVAAGAVYSVTITGGEGVPQVRLDGVTGNTEGSVVGLQVLLENGVHTAKIKVPADMKAGTVFLLTVTEGGRKLHKDKQHIKITVLGAPTKP